MAGTGHLTTLPTELRLQVLELVRQGGDRWLRALSRTCTLFFHLLEAELYETVVLRADSRSGRSIQSIAAGKRASLVRNLVFRTRDPRPAWERQNDTRHQLSIESKQALTFLHRLSNLCTFELDVDWKLDLWFSDYPEPRLYPINGYSETYRVILDECLRALGRSVHHSDRYLPKLSVRRLPPRAYRALVDHGLHQLLNNLHSFHIEFLDHNNSGPLVRSHGEFIENLDAYFLSHLRNVRILHLQASPNALIGEADELPGVEFAKLNLPKLRKLVLEHVVLGPQAEKFIVRHLKTLHCVTLDHCYRDQSWATLFRKVVARKPAKLTRFEVLPVDVTTNHGLVECTAARRAFSRVQVDCGRLWHASEDVLDELAVGHTISAWVRLQRLVERNRTCWVRFTESRQGLR